MLLRFLESLVFWAYRAMPMSYNIRLLCHLLCYLAGFLGLHLSLLLPLVIVLDNLRWLLETLALRVEQRKEHILKWIHIHKRHWRLHIVVVSNVHNQLPVEVRCGGSLVIVGDAYGRLAPLPQILRVHLALILVELNIGSMHGIVAISAISCIDSSLIV